MKSIILVVLYVIAHNKREDRILDQLKKHRDKKNYQLQIY